MLCSFLKATVLQKIQKGSIDIYMIVETIYKLKKLLLSPYVPSKILISETAPLHLNLNISLLNIRS